MNMINYLPYYPLENTGTGNAVHFLSKGLIKAGANLKVFAEGHDFKQDIYDGVPYIKFKKNHTKNPFNISKDLIEFFKAEKSNIDLVLLNGIFTPYTYTLSRLLIKLDIPYIHIPHGVYNKIAFKKSFLKKISYFFFFEKRLIENALAVQLNSKVHFSSVKKLSNPKNLIAVPNPIDINAYINNNYSLKIKKESGKIRLIFWGRKDIYIKGLDILLKAMKKLENENIELIIQGLDVKNSEKKLKNYIKRFSLKNVVIKEKYNGNPIHELSKYDLFILPSRLESFSMATIEAMLAKLPIIVSENVGASEYVKKANAGIICKSNPIDLYVAIKKMLSLKDKWSEFGNNGYKYVVNNLNIDTVGLNTFSLYKNLLKNV